jgi:DNA-binding transcriptional ArsR family regulator
MANQETQAGASGRLPDVVMERVADRFRLLGDPTRLRLVNELHADGELSVGELVERVGMSYGAVSKQLALLRSNSIVARRREGTRIYYRISDPSIGDLCDAVCKRMRTDWADWGAQLEAQLSQN